MELDVSERSLSLEAVLVYRFALMVILFLVCLSFGRNSGRDLWAVMAMSEDQIMQVRLVVFTAKYAGASMSSISSLASILS